MLVKSGEMTGTQLEPNTAMVAGGEGVKTTENRIRWPPVRYLPAEDDDSWTSLVTSNQLTMGTYAERSTVNYSMPP